MFQRFAGKLAGPVDLHGQRCFLFGGFAAHACHLQLRIDARDQFAGGERFGEVVIGAGFDTFNARLFAGARREHDDGDGSGGRIAVECREQRKAIHLRHHDIGQDKSWEVCARSLPCACFPFPVATT